MRRHLIIPALVIAAGLAVTPLASASAAPANPAACAEATAAVGLAAIDTAMKAQALTDAQATLAAANDKVQKAARALVDAEKVPVAERTAAQIASVMALTTAYNTALDQFRAAIDPKTDVKLADALKAARAALQAKLDAAVVACVEATPPTSTPPAPPVFFADCDAVRAAGATPLLRGEPGYRPELDANGNGHACEITEPAPPVVRPAPRPQFPTVAPETGGYQS